VKWIRWLLVAVLAALVGFSGWRAWHAFRERPGALFAQRGRHSAALPGDTWQQFSRFLKTARAVAERNQRPIDSIQLMELTQDAASAIYWLDEHLKNPGFSPLQNFERQRGGGEVELLGFYTLDGRPLKFTERSNPKNPQQHVLTVHLDEPVAPGKTELILRRERRPLNGDAGRDGARTIELKDLPATPTRLHVRAVRLTADAALVDYEPKPAEQVAQAGPPMVGWLSDQFEADTPVRVTFRL